MTTKRKILAAALDLFNQNGAPDVSTNHIAAALGMSPGNLYYHYRNKEAIIHALFHDFDTATGQLFTLSGTTAPTPDDVDRMILGNFELQWQYRFLFHDLMALLRRDPNLAAAYQTHRQRGFEGTRQLLRTFADRGAIAPLHSDDDLDELTRLIWLVSEFWLPTLELDGEVLTPETVQRGATLFRRLSQWRLPPSD